MLNNKPTAIIFDLDGTIVDSRAIILQCLKHTANGVYGHDHSDEKLLAEVGIPLIQEMQTLVPEDPYNAVQVYRNFYHSLEHKEPPAFPGMQELIASLHESGLPLGIATSKLREGMESDLAYNQLIDMFDCLIAADDVVNPKPNPEPLLTVAAQLGVNPSECWYVGDSTFDMIAAQRAGMKAVAVLWGNMFSQQDLADAGAQAFLSTVQDFIDLVKSWE